MGASSPAMRRQATSLTSLAAGGTGLAARHAHPEALARAACSGILRCRASSSLAAGEGAAEPGAALFDTSDHEKVLAGKTTWQLLVEAATFGACAQPWLMDPVVAALRAESVLAAPLQAVLRRA